MRKAVIDIGTNSVRLAVADVAGKELDMQHQQVEYARIGEGVTEDGIIKENPLQRNYDTIVKLVGVAKEYRADYIGITATSAIRDAKNRENVCRVLEQAANIPIRVLSGEEEAQLSYLGACGDFLYLRKPLAVMDIGGGSTELVYHVDGILHRASVPIGAVRLAEHPNTLPQAKETLHTLAQAPLPKDVLCIGVGGTNTGLRAMELGLKQYDAQMVHGGVLRKDQVAIWTEKLFHMTLEERLQIPGLNPNRADIIPYGAWILLEMMNLLKQNEITVSDKGLVYGLLLEDMIQ